MSARYPDRNTLANKIEWEGGILESVSYGIRAADMPEGDDELTAAWAALESAHKTADEARAAVAKLLKIEEHES